MSLTMAAGLAVTAFTSPATAGPLPTLSGWGVRDYGGFMGSVSQQADGSLRGISRSSSTNLVKTPSPVACAFAPTS